MKRNFVVSVVWYRALGVWCWEQCGSGDHHACYRSHHQGYGSYSGYRGGYGYGGGYYAPRYYAPSYGYGSYYRGGYAPGYYSPGYSATTVAMVEW